MNDNERQLLEQIAIDPGVMTGKPVIRGSRLTVQFILGLLGHGMSIEEVLEEYQGLKRDDVLACLLFAQQSLADITFMPLTVDSS